MRRAKDFAVTRLGEARVDARAIEGLKKFTSDRFWVADDVRIPCGIRFKAGERVDTECAFELAGARESLFFQPGKVTAGIVTCGGISPGLNDVIRALFMELRYVYGVPRILGFPSGLRGLDPRRGLKPLELNHETVVGIQNQGGTMLGTSRGHLEPGLAVDRLQAEGVDQLFVVGGDGSQRAAHAIWEAAARRGIEIAIVGIPKTIDNDINFVYKTFGFDTAISFARQALDAAHIEATGNPNGIGLVKLMGRDSGYIAAYATLASINVNFTLVPEIPFHLQGTSGLLACLEARIKARGHAVIAVAEGAGQDLIGAAAREQDASGNLKHHDIGVFLKEEITAHFALLGQEINLKYIDPSYMLRSLPSNANDSIYAADLARYAVHAAMAGKTDLMIGRRFNHYIHVPLPVVVATRKKINPQSELWMAVLQATGQPGSMLNGS